MDYSLDPKYDYDETREPDIKVIESTADIITNNGLPVVCSLSLCLTILCVGILSKSIFKGSFYKYLFYNSFFDSVTLCTVLLRPFLKKILTEDIHELYFYCFVTTFSLTTANIIRFIISFDRYSRMTLKCRYFFKRSPCLIIWFGIFISILCTSPVLIFHDFLEFEWYKLTFFELSLSEAGNSNPIGKFILLDALAVNIGVYISLIYFNRLLKKTVKENLKKLEHVIEIEKNKSKEFIINIVNDLDDLKEYENDDMSEMDFEKLCSKSAKKSCSGSKIKPGDLNNLESNRTRKSPIEIERCRKKLSDMILFSNYVFIFGHGINIILSICEQLKNLFGYKNFQLKIGKITDETDTTAPILAVSNILLYSSMGINFFIFFYFNTNFRFIVEKAFKQTFKCLFCMSCSIEQQIKPDKIDKEHLLKLI